VALGAAAVAAVPHMVAWLAPEPAVCRIQPNGLPLLTDLLREQEREQALRHRLAELETSRGQRRANCPLPPPPPPPVQRVEQEGPPVTPPEREQPREERAPGPSAAEPPPNTMPCNQEAASGSQGVTRNRHSLGPQPGRVTLHYNTMQNPDHIRVWYRGQVIAETPGPVSYTGSISFDWTPPPGSAEDQVVEVEVTGRGRGTRWIYTLGCPGP
jgi:hypothetical protein